MLTHVHSCAHTCDIKPANCCPATQKSFCSIPCRSSYGGCSMRFRPCVDLHQGKVKQIVGSSLKDNEQPITNFETEKSSADFVHLYRDADLWGGHIIMLGPNNEDAARAALEAWPGKLQVGGGITADNAAAWISAGASHVIVTSYLFVDNQLSWERLNDLVSRVGKDKIVIDLSCRKKPEHGDTYFVVTDRWQRFTEFEVSPSSLQLLANYCDEFLVHGVDVEGKRCGVLDDLISILASSPIPVTYAGGASSLDDLDHIKRIGNDRVDATIGSALDIFGGSLPYSSVVTWQQDQN
eukprot:c20116_g1_i6.p1 GENE.c20116_g1_i6~~c20116_g1_i6.p1  ORF type:complete len:295 (-),score=63.40 c20116_g1_i6:785-1669(-)